MKKFIPLIITVLSINDIYSQSGKYWEKHWGKLDKHPVRQIIVGCIYTGLGCSIITESINQQNDSYYYGLHKPPIYGSILLASLGGGAICYGGFLIAHGIKLNRQQKLNVGVTSNGIGLIYKL